MPMIQTSSLLQAMYSNYVFKQIDKDQWQVSSERDCIQQKLTVDGLIIIHNRLNMKTNYTVLNKVIFNSYCLTYQINFTYCIYSFSYLYTIVIYLFTKMYVTIVKRRGISQILKYLKCRLLPEKIIVLTRIHY